MALLKNVIYTILLLNLFYFPLDTFGVPIEKPFVLNNEQSSQNRNLEIIEITTRKIVIARIEPKNVHSVLNAVRKICKPGEQLDADGACQEVLDI